MNFVAKTTKNRERGKINTI